MAIDCDRYCCREYSRPDPNEIVTKIGTFHNLGSCHYCHPRDLDELNSPRWQNREVIEVVSKRRGSLRIRLCRAHARQIAAASRLPG